MNKQSGFTLLEVMVALFIFAVSGTAILKTTAEHLNSVSQLEQITFATYVANNQLMRMSIQSEQSWPPKNNQKGKVEMVDRTWYWQQSVSNTIDEELKQVTVTVGLDADYQGSITSVVTFVAKPST